MYIIMAHIDLILPQFSGRFLCDSAARIVSRKDVGQPGPSRSSGACCLRLAQRGGGGGCCGCNTARAAVAALLMAIRKNQTIDIGSGIAGIAPYYVLQGDSGSRTVVAVENKKKHKNKVVVQTFTFKRDIFFL